MNVFGLIGYPLTHSFSPVWFAEMFARNNIVDCEYLLFPIESIEELPSLLNRQPSLVGFNVTIPYKEIVIPYLDELSDAAKQIGAVNCVHIYNRKLVGHNTDYLGFIGSLENISAKSIQQVFILGSGGASKAVQYACKQIGLPYYIVSRTEVNSKGCITYDNVRHYYKPQSLIVNTTPIGMYPHVNDVPPFPIQLVGVDDFVFDLVYNPPQTAFMKLAEQQGARVMNGYRMLEIQAEESWKIWTSKK